MSDYQQDQQAEAVSETVRRNCQYAGVEYRPHGFSMHEVLTLLDRCHYVSDADCLYRLIHRGRVIRDNQLDWSDRMVYQAFVWHESARQWQNGENPHAIKKSAARLLLEQHGDHEMAKDVGQMPLLELLLILTETDHRAVREGLLEAVLVKLKTLECEVMD